MFAFCFCAGHLKIKVICKAGVMYKMLESIGMDVVFRSDGAYMFYFHSTSSICLLKGLFFLIPLDPDIAEGCSPIFNFLELHSRRYGAKKTKYGSKMLIKNHWVKFKQFLSKLHRPVSCSLSLPTLVKKLPLRTFLIFNFR